MNLKLRDEILTAKRLVYVDSDSAIPENAVDCSAGYNPYGAPGRALIAMQRITPRMVYDYPHGFELQEAIAEYWSEHARLNMKNIILTDGSIGGIYAVNIAFAKPGAVMLSFSPQFSDYTTIAKYMGFQYRPVYLKPENDYRVMPSEMIAAIDDDVSLIYIDNPNNPTGQSIPLNDLRRMLGKARKCGACVLVDEAYGDYMEKKASAINLLDEYENLVVLRTFSKGLGLAGLRCGYMLGANELLGMINKIWQPFSISQPARAAAAAVLSDSAFIQSCREKIAISKAALKSVLGKQLKMAHTLASCPIALVWHEDKHVDLMCELKKRGVLTYSGCGFDNLGINSVRLRVPKNEQCERLYSAVRELNEGML